MKRLRFFFLNLIFHIALVPLYSYANFYDNDNDGVINELELNYYQTNPSGQDTDNDGLSDGTELTYIQTIKELPFEVCTITSCSDGTRFFVCFATEQELKGCFFDLRGNQIDQLFTICRISNFSFTYLINNKVSIAYNGSKYCVVWNRYSEEFSQSHIYSIILDHNGTPLCDKILLSSGISGDNTNPCIASNGKNFYVVWKNTSENEIKLYGANLNQSNYSLSSITIMDSQRLLHDGMLLSENTFIPKITSNEDTYFVAWKNIHYVSLIITLSDLILDKILPIDLPIDSAWSIFIPELPNDRYTYNHSIYGQIIDGEGNRIGSKKHYRSTYYADTDTSNPDVISSGKNYFLSYYDYDLNNRIYWLITDDYTTIKRGHNNTAGNTTALYANEFFIILPTTFVIENNQLQTTALLIDNNFVNHLSGLYFPLDLHTFFLSKTNCENTVLSIYKDTEKLYLILLKIGTGSSPLLADSDNDGLNDMLEIYYNTKPYLNDTDNDTINDYQEISVYNTSPSSADSDNDGINDGSEINIFSTNPLLKDSDNDGLNDGFEVSTHYFDGFESGDFSVFGWGQSYYYQNSNWIVTRNGTNTGTYCAYVNTCSGIPALSFTVDVPTKSFVSFYYKTDQTGLRLRINDLETPALHSFTWEKAQFPLPEGTSKISFRTSESIDTGTEIISGQQVSANSVTYRGVALDDVFVGNSENIYITDPLNPDSDNDGINDGLEILSYKTNPINKDTDGDFVPDDHEIYYYKSGPLSQDSDNDGLFDGEEGISIFPEHFYNSINPVIDYFARHLFSYVGPSFFSGVYSSQNNLFTVAWTDFTWKLNIQNLNSSGIPVSEATELGNNYITPPVTAFNGTNYLIVCGKSSENTNPLIGILLDENGEIISEVTIAPSGSQEIRAIDIATDGTNFCVVWSIHTIERHELKAQLISSSGTPMGEQKTITFSKTFKISIDSNGESYFISYYRLYNFGPFLLYWIIQPPHLHFGQLLDNNLNPLTDLIELPGTGSQVTSVDENYLVTCEDIQSGTIDALIYSPDGNLLKRIDSIAQVDNVSAYQLFYHDVIYNGDNFLFTFFSSFLEDGPNADLYALILDKNFQPITDKIKFAQGVFDSYMPPKAVSFGSDYLVFYNIWDSVYSKKISYGLGTSLTNPDSDNDGLSDGYEFFDFLSDPLLPDTDFDGCNDSHEKIAGTDPLDENSKFQVTVITELSYFYGTPVILLGWDSVKGKNYTIYVKSESIGPDFVILKDNITADGNKSYYFDNGGGPNNISHPSKENGSRLYKIITE